jgi:histidinol-phosphate/aromatic aminotransferase/cobyric acid decarboxylase-like protein/choline kinase
MLNDATAPASRAVILAAGLGSRLGLFSRRLPKPLLPVAGRPMLLRCLDSLAAAGVLDVVIVVGHLAGEIRQRVGSRWHGMEITYVEVAEYETKNEIYSLWLAREYLDRDAIVIEADVVFEQAVLTALSSIGGPEVNVIAASAHEHGMDGTVVRATPDGRTLEICYAVEQTDGYDFTGTLKTMNIYLLRTGLLRESFLPELDRLVRSGCTDLCFEVALAPGLRGGRFPFAVADCSDLAWWEVDSHDDRRTAEYRLAGPTERFATLEHSYGGYWRHGVVDHRLLCNVHFPSDSMLERLAADLSKLVTQYPVGQRSLAELASQAFGHPAEHLVVVNGSSELIRILAEHTSGAVLLPTPGFNEYENAFGADRVIAHPLSEPGFALDVDALADQAERVRARTVVVVTPNNPTSLAVEREDLARLARRLNGLGALLIVDESFVDFCEQPAERTLTGEVGRHPNLLVLKSVSKVYGIGGLRLGYGLTSDLLLRSTLLGALPIWNVNGLAEAFMRHLPVFYTSFEESCGLVREDRDQLYRLLCSLDGVRALRPAANFVMARLPAPWTSPELAQRLFAEHGILIKDCAGKSMQEGDRWLRIASRTQQENTRVAGAMAELLAPSREPCRSGHRTRGQSSTL